MRKEIYRADRASSLALLSRVPVVHVASTAADGSVVMKTVHGVVVDGYLAFHGASAGEKTAIVGREAVVSAEEIVANIPSYFVDPERACPATTYYRSVQVHGTLTALEEPSLKARVLSALMTKYQPEGGHVPIDPDHALYKKAVDSILVVGVSLAHLDGKAKLGQNRKPEELTTIMQRLWERGDPGDLRAIELLRQANPTAKAPAFLAAPEGAALTCAPEAQDALSAATMLEDAYWNADFTRDEIAKAHVGSAAWVGARDTSGALIATARAVSDGHKRAWIYDVAVHERHRRAGLGRAVMRLLLSHPAVRRVRYVSLGTRDAEGFYAKLGFEHEARRPKKPYVATTMVLCRA